MSTPTSNSAYFQHFDMRSLIDWVGETKIFGQSDAVLLLLLIFSADNAKLNEARAR